jgi:hypothetical protein
VDFNILDNHFIRQILHICQVLEKEVVLHLDSRPHAYQLCTPTGLKKSCKSVRGQMLFSTFNKYGSLSSLIKALLN